MKKSSLFILPLLGLMGVCALQPIQENQLVIAEQESPFKVTDYFGEHGCVISNSFAHYVNSKIELKVKPDFGYKCAQVYKNGKPVPQNENGKYEITVEEGDNILTADFVETRAFIEKIVAKPGFMFVPQTYAVAHEGYLMPIKIRSKLKTLPEVANVKINGEAVTYKTQKDSLYGLTVVYVNLKDGANVIDIELTNSIPELNLKVLNSDWGTVDVEQDGNTIASNYTFTFDPKPGYRFYKMAAIGSYFFYENKDNTNKFTANFFDYLYVPPIPDDKEPPMTKYDLTLVPLFYELDSNESDHVITDAGVGVEITSTSINDGMIHCNYQEAYPFEAYKIVVNGVDYSDMVSVLHSSFSLPATKNQNYVSILAKATVDDVSAVQMIPSKDAPNLGVHPIDIADWYEPGTPMPNMYKANSMVSLDYMVQPDEPSSLKTATVNDKDVYVTRNGNSLFFLDNGVNNIKGTLTPDFNPNKIVKTDSQTLGDEVYTFANQSRSYHDYFYKVRDDYDDYRENIADWQNPGITGEVINYRLKQDNMYQRVTRIREKNEWGVVIFELKIVQELVLFENTYRFTNKYDINGTCDSLLYFEEKYGLNTILFTKDHSYYEGPLDNNFRTKFLSYKNASASDNYTNDIKPFLDTLKDTTNETNVRLTNNYYQPLPNETAYNKISCEKMCNTQFINDVISNIYVADNGEYVISKNKMIDHKIEFYPGFVNGQITKIDDSFTLIDQSNLANYEIIKDFIS